MSISNLLDQTTGQIQERFIPGTPHTTSRNFNYSDIVDAGALTVASVPVLYQTYTANPWIYDSTKLDNFSMSANLQMFLTQTVGSGLMTGYLYYYFALYNETTDEELELAGDYKMRVAFLNAENADSFVNTSMTAQVLIPSTFVSQGDNVSVRLYMSTTSSPNVFTVGEEEEDIYSLISLTLYPCETF